MAFDLLNTVKGFFSNDIINKAVGYLGESETHVRKGLDTVIPVSLAGIVKKVEDGNVESVLSLAREAMGSGILDNLEGTFSSSGGGIPTVGPALITGILGEKFGSIANSVSSFAGIKGSTTSSLFGSVLPLALAALGRHVKDNNAAPGAITSLLNSQKNSILAALPSGFDLSKIMGISLPKVDTNFKTAPPAKSGNRWLFPLVLILAGVLILWWLMKSCDSRKIEPPALVPDTAVTTKTETETLIKEPLKITLPNNMVLDAYKGGIEDLLVTFLNDPNSQPGKDNWFDLNDLNFKFGTAEILPESQKQLDNIVQILKAYPKVKIKIGGYTDNVGDEATNMKLSQDRADAVLNELNEAGVGAQVEGAEGYGSEFAKYPGSAPEEDRVKDRRVSVSVRAK